MEARSDDPVGDPATTSHGLVRAVCREGVAPWNFQVSGRERNPTIYSETPAGAPKRKAHVERAKRIHREILQFEVRNLFSIEHDNELASAVRSRPAVFSTATNLPMALFFAMQRELTLRIAAGEADAMLQPDPSPDKTVSRGLDYRVGSGCQDSSAMQSEMCNGDVWLGRFSL